MNVQPFQRLSTCHLSTTNGSECRAPSNDRPSKRNGHTWSQPLGNGPWKREVAAPEQPTIDVQWLSVVVAPEKPTIDMQRVKVVAAASSRPSLPAISRPIMCGCRPRATENRSATASRLISSTAATTSCFNMWAMPKPSLEDIVHTHLVVPLLSPYSPKYCPCRPHRCWFRALLTNLFAHTAFFRPHLWGRLTQIEGA